MFVEPDGNESKTAAKADPTAPARSSIRRQRTIRSNTRTNLRPSSPLPSRAHHPGQGIGGNATERRSLLEDIRRIGQDSPAQTTEESLTNGIRDLEALADRNRSRVSHMLDVAGGQATHRSRVEIAGDDAHASRNLPQALALPHESGRRNSSLPHDIRLPGYTPIHPPTNNPRDSLDPTLGQSPPPPLGHAAFTPGFAPANRLNTVDTTLRHSERMVNIASLANQVRDLRMLPHQQGGQLELERMLADLNDIMVRNASELSSDYLIMETDWINTMRRRLERIRSRAIRMLDAVQTPSLNSAEPVSSRHVRRRLHSTSRPRDDIDGLGDRVRERSFSPEVVSWETMLTTIPPDDQVPSNQSSFNSVTTSASNASLGAASAASTSTAPSSVEIEQCPALDSSGSEAEDIHDDGTGSSSVHAEDGSSNFLSQANGHRDRVQSLSRRLRQQRSQGEFMARHRRIVEREAELQQLEMTLQRLERQLEEERSVNASWQRSGGIRAGRERL